MFFFPDLAVALRCVETLWNTVVRKENEQTTVIYTGNLTAFFFPPRYCPRARARGGGGTGRVPFFLSWHDLSRTPTAGTESMYGVPVVSTDYGSTEHVLKVPAHKDARITQCFAVLFVAQSTFLPCQSQCQKSTRLCRCDVPYKTVDVFFVCFCFLTLTVNSQDQMPLQASSPPFPLLPMSALLCLW